MNSVQPTTTALPWVLEIDGKAATPDSASNSGFSGKPTYSFVIVPPSTTEWKTAT